jgi:hypothetical protein
MSGVREPANWARRNFVRAPFGDVRRVRRLLKLARAMAERPGESLVGLCKTPYDVKATYKFLRHPEVTPDNLQHCHRELTTRSLREPGTVSLLLEDTSEISWNTSLDIPDLGPTGDDNPRVKGFLLHSVLAVRWCAPHDPAGPHLRPAAEVLGLERRSSPAPSACPLSLWERVAGFRFPDGAPLRAARGPIRKEGVREYGRSDPSPAPACSYPDPDI